MDIQIGDKVRFLNAVGGGKVTGFEKGGFILVEDEDGFDIPVHQSEIVVVPTDYKESYMERLAGDNLVNTSKPTAQKGKSAKSTISSAENVGPTSKDHTEQGSLEEKKSQAQTAREFDLEQRIIQLEMTVHQLSERLERIEARHEQREAQKKQELAQREERHHQSISSKGQNDIIEVDLHINELLDSTAGLNAADMKAYQLQVFRRTMDQNRGKKGQRIVFIHGNGEGALRKSIIDELRARYKSCEYQDASFQQYGFGATMVIVH